MMTNDMRSMHTVIVLSGIFEVDSSLLSEDMYSTVCTFLHLLILLTFLLKCTGYSFRKGEKHTQENAVTLKIMRGVTENF